MEINLNRSTLDGLFTVVDSIISIEETAETIVPDSYPDAESVTATPATALIRVKETRPGTVTVSGTVKAKVHYMTEDGGSGKTIDVVIPFGATVNNPAITEMSQVAATVKVASAESRVLNSRKVLTRANVNLALQIYNDLSESYTSSANAEGIEVQSEVFAAWLPYLMREKSFVISDELELPQTAKPAAEVMSAVPSLIVTECKMVGNKVVFKGDANIAVVYMTPDGEVEGASFTLPFSQLIEMEGAVEEDDCTVTLALTGFDCMVDDDLTETSRKFTCNLSVAAQAVASRVSEHTVVVDLYSTGMETEVEYGTLDIGTLLSREKLHRNFRTFVDTGEPASQILGTKVSFRDVAVNTEGGGVDVTGVADAFITYLDRDNIPHTESVSIETSVDAGQLGGGSYIARYELTDVDAVSVDNGIELRIGADVNIDSYKQSEIQFVDSAVVTEQPIRMSCSAILRRVREGDTLWNLAKQYGTTVAAILSMNDIENPDLIYPGQMILIA